MLVSRNQQLVPLNDGCKIPRFGFGLGGVPSHQTESRVGEAINAGYTLFDTAAIYGNEKALGRAIRAASSAGEGIFLQSKLLVTDHGYDSALRACEAALLRLGLETVDLYLIHWPAPAYDRYVDTWRALIRLKEEKRLRSIGVSNFTIAHLSRLQQETGVLPAVNQIELHPRFPQSALRDFHRGAGIVTQAYSPLGKGSVLTEPVVVNIGRKHKKSSAQVILRWHLELGTVPISTAENPMHMSENASVSDFSLDADDMSAMAKVTRWTGRMYGHPETYNGETTVSERIKSALVHPSKIARRVLKITGL